MSNVYCHPEDHGLTTIGEVEWSDGNYQFDLTVVWQDADGKLYWAEDAGCSCPLPFGFRTKEDLTTGTFWDLHAHLSERLNDGSRRNRDRAVEVAELMTRAREATS